MESASPGLTLVVALLAGVLAQSLARHLHVPGIVVLLLAGATLGPDVLGWIEPRSLDGGLFLVVDLAVAVILFEGGLNLEISRLRREQTPIRRLVTLGALTTLAGGAAAAHLVLGWPLMLAVLFGSLVVVTGPTVIGPLLRELRLRPRPATVLEAEGVLIDPIGAILALLALELALAPGGETLWDSAGAAAVRLGFGAVAGGAAGLLLGWLLRLQRIVPEGHENILALAFVLALYESCDAVVSPSGIVAVTVAGIVVGNTRTRVDRDLREFKDQLSALLIGLLFVLLAADVRFENVRALGWPGLAVVAALVAGVRPLGVALSTAGSELSLRERLFVAWIAPRGIVAAAIASLTAGAMGARGLEGGLELRALVFLTIAVTVLLAGLTALPLAALLGLRLPGREAVAILGAHDLALALGEALRSAGAPVVLLDSNPVNARRAQEAGFRVVYGDALRERTLQRARFDEVGTAVGLTPNATLNSVFATRAREIFRVPRRYVAMEPAGAERAVQVEAGADASVLFERPHDVERWDVRFRHGDASVERWVFQKAELEEAPDRPPPAAQQTGERFAMLAVRRGREARPMSLGWKPQPGDVATIVLHEPERAEAERALRGLGWVPEAEAESQAEAREAWHAAASAEEPRARGKGGRGAGGASSGA